MRSVISLFTCHLCGGGRGVLVKGEGEIGRVMGLKDVQWAESSSVQCASDEKYSMDAVLGGRWGQRDSSVADTRGTRTHFNHCFTALPSHITMLYPLYYLCSLPFHITTLHPIYYTSISPHSTPTCNIFPSQTSSNQWRLLSTALYSSLCISTIDLLQFICPVSYTKRCMLYLQGVPIIHGEAFSWQGAG